MAFPHAGYADARYSSFSNIAEIHQHFTVADQQGEGAQQRLNLFCEKMHQWLAPPDPSMNHNDACEKRQESTGAWFVDSRRFSNWKEEPHSFIWLHSMPGSGKTILCSNIIEQVSSHCSAALLRALAYFYFNFNDERKQVVRSLICSLISQFSSQCAHIPDDLVTLYSKCQQGRQQPKTADLAETLRDIIAGFRQAYVILDALDECREQQKLLAFLAKMVGWQHVGLHILAMSHPERIIEVGLASRVSDAINLQSDIVHVDIAAYIHENLQNDSRLSKWPSEIRANVETSLLKGANGMFLWVVCQLDVLSKYLTADMIKTALKTLLKSLDETYAQILLNIDELYREDACKVLQWLAFSARPVTLAEVAEALTINIDDEHHLNSDRQLLDPHDMLKICSSLITMSSLSDCNDNTAILRLAHFSVKEYLISQRIQDGPAAKYSLSKKDADTSISCTCLAYLMRFSILDCLQPNTIASFPLAEYAAEHWIYHAKSDDGTIQEVLQSLIADLLEPHGTRFINWVQLYNCDKYCECKDLLQEPESIAPPLYYASLKGLKEVSQWLLVEKRVDINAQGGVCGSALQAAASEGNLPMVELLLEKGADVNPQGGYPRNALEFAAANGHLVIVELLLENGADINAQEQEEGCNGALQAAVLSGNMAIVKLLLEKGADINTQGGEYGNALQAAASTGNMVIMKLLLESGADINAQQEYYGNALQAVALHGLYDIVKLLLENGADINAQGGEDGNALQAAAFGAHKQIVKLLLENGADVNAQGGDCGNALQAAALSGHQQIVKLLLENGAVINAQGGAYGNALQAAALNGDIVIVKLLLENGADINAQCGCYGSALQAAAAAGHQKTVELLLKKGADIDVQGGVHGSALQAARLHDDQAIVILLLEMGAVNCLSRFSRKRKSGPAGLENLQPTKSQRFDDTEAASSVQKSVTR